MAKHTEYYNELERSRLVTLAIQLWNKPTRGDSDTAKLRALAVGILHSTEQAVYLRSEHPSYLNEVAHDAYRAGYGGALQMLCDISDKAGGGFQEAGDIFNDQTSREPAAWYTIHLCTAALFGLSKNHAPLRVHAYAIFEALRWANHTGVEIAALEGIVHLTIGD